MEVGISGNLQKNERIREEQKTKDMSVKEKEEKKKENI